MDLINTTLHVLRFQAIDKISSDTDATCAHIFWII